MAKRIIRRNAPTLKNAHMIGGGAKFTPVYSNKGKINWRGSVMKQSRSHTMPKMPKTASKKPVRQISTSFKTSFKAHQLNQPQQMTVKASTVRLMGLQKMKKQIAKSAPSPKIQMKSRQAVKRKPPSKGR